MKTYNHRTKVLSSTTLTSDIFPFYLEPNHNSNKSDRKDSSNISPVPQDNDHDLSINEIYKSIKDDFCKFQVVEEDKIISKIDISRMPNLASIEKFVEKVIASDQLGYLRIDELNKTGFVTSKFRELKLSFYFKLMNSYILNIYQHDAYFIYSENVKLFLDGCDALNLREMRFSNPGHLLVGLNKFEAEIFNDLIKFIRNKSKSVEFKEQVRNRIANADRMQGSLEAYVQGLFDNCSRIEVLRVDLGYATIQDASGFHRQNIPLDQAIRDRDRFINNMRHNVLFKAMIGYVWKVEYAELKGYHFHWIFFYDSSKVKNEIHIANQIGLYWREVVTKKSGVFFNCNAKKASYTHLGIGRIHATHPADADLRFNLIHFVLRYLTKTEQFLKVKLGEKSRVFGTMQVREKSPRGKPRNEWTAATASIPVEGAISAATDATDEEYDLICY